MIENGTELSLYIYVIKYSGCPDVKGENVESMLWVEWWNRARI